MFANNESTISSNTELFTFVKHEVIGFILLLISCTAFSLQFAPLRNLDAKDGVFVQWVQCSVVFLCGFVINLVRNSPSFNTITIIGGFLYATGNIGSVPIVSEMGMGVGMLVWGSVQIIVGWCVANFGLFGTKRQTVSHTFLNYIGLVLTLVSGVMFVFVYGRNSLNKDKSLAKGLPAVKNDSRSNSIQDVLFTHRNDCDSNASLPVFRSFFFIGFAVFLGCFHGLMMTPITYIMDNDPAHLNSVLDYMFAHFSSVFFFSTIYFIIYTIMKRGRPYVHVDLILPSMLYGVLFCIGMTFWFISSQMLSQTISYPIAVRLPAILSALLEMYIFKSIQGVQRQYVLLIATAVGVAGVVSIGLSF